MPSNIITINNSKELTWVIGDSQMEKIIAVLDECGDKTPDAFLSYFKPSIED